MNKFLVVVVLVILVGGFAASAYASYNGVGLVTSGTGSTSSRGMIFIFPGGGPGSGK